MVIAWIFEVHKLKDLLCVTKKNPSVVIQDNVLSNPVKKLGPKLILEI